MRPYLRRLPDGNLAVLFYIAERQMSDFGASFRPTFVVGPGWLGLFSQRADYFAGIGELAFLTPGGGPPGVRDAQRAIHRGRHARRR